MLPRTNIQMIVSISGPEFPAGWAGKKTKRLRNKAEALKQKVRSTARKVYENHFREAQSQPRGVVAKLTQIVHLVEKACQRQIINESEWRILMTSALEELTELLGDESKVSAYELHSSGLIQALLKVFATNSSYPENDKARRRAAKLQKHRVEIFRKCFLQAQVGGQSPAYQLARKLVSVLESIEKLPVYLYDYNNTGFGLQILARRLRFKLEKASGEDSLLDRTGCGFRMEPLASVKQLEKFLLKMVAKQWFDYDR